VLFGAEQHPYAFFPIILANKSAQLIFTRAARSLQRLLVRAKGSLQASEATRPLKGAIATAAEWVRANGHGSVVDIASDSPIEVPPGDVRCGAIPKALATPETLLYPPLYAAVLPGVRILDGEGFAIVDDRLILDMSPHYGRASYDHSAMLRWRLPPLEHLDSKVLVLSGIDPTNHYHWLLDILPRFEVARLAGLDWDHMIAPTITPVQRTCLQRLGIDAKSVLPPPWNRQLLVREAVLAVFPSHRHGPSPFAVRFIRALFADCLEPSAATPRRIFVSRSRCTQRRVTNEAQVEIFLRGRGFTSIFLETMTIEDQARFFANAEIVVAPHGAGLTNAAFCSPGTRLIELFSSRHTPGFFRRLAAVCGLDYLCMVDGSQPYRWNGARCTGRDMHVDLGRLGRLL